MPSRSTARKKSKIPSVGKTLPLPFREFLDNCVIPALAEKYLDQHPKEKTVKIDKAEYITALAYDGESMEVRIRKSKSHPGMYRVTPMNDNKKPFLLGEGELSAILGELKRKLKARDKKRGSLVVGTVRKSKKHPGKYRVQIGEERMLLSTQGISDVCKERKLTRRLLCSYAAPQFDLIQERR